MTIGRMEALHLILPVVFRLPEIPDLELEFVLDTGFTGDLTLPLATVQRLGLEFKSKLIAKLATDDAVELLVYGAIIVWQGEVREVNTLATGTRPLLGTALLSGDEMTAQFVENGLVTVDEL